VSFPDRHATAPSMVVLDPGASSGAASVAVQVFANAGTSGRPDDIELARARVAPPWPSGAALDEAPELQGEFALGGGALAETVDAPPTLALAWHRDNAAVGRPQFRSVDPASWTQGPNVQLDSTGDTIFAFVAGAGVGSDGAWAGDGFAVAWRYVGAPGLGPARPVGALLDAAGNVLRGPTPMATGEDYPGRSASMAWTGSAYLVAMTYDDCHGGDGCVAHSVVVQSVRVSADAAAGLALAPASSFPVLDPSTTPGGSAAMAALRGRAWVAWTEGLARDAGAVTPRTVRLATLDAGGRALGAPVTLATAILPTTRLAVSAGDAGVLVTWAEDADPADDGGAGDVVPGASSVVVQRVGFDGALDAPLRVLATRVDAFGPVTSATIAAPRGALVLWAGRSTDPARFDMAWMAELACAP
jgi:hypothetical protein